MEVKLEKCVYIYIYEAQKAETVLSAVIYIYNPPNNFCGLLLDKTDHMIQNWTMDIRGYPPSDFMSVV